MIILPCSPGVGWDCWITGVITSSSSSAYAWDKGRTCQLAVAPSLHRSIIVHNPKAEWTLPQCTIVYRIHWTRILWNHRKIGHKVSSWMGIGIRVSVCQDGENSLVNAMEPQDDNNKHFFFQMQPWNQYYNRYVHVSKNSKVIWLFHVIPKLLVIEHCL